MLNSSIILFISLIVVRIITIKQKYRYAYNEFGITEMIICLLIFIFSIVHFKEIKNNKKIGFLDKPLIYAYIFRLFLLFWDLYFRNIYNLPNSGSDTEHFYKIAVRIAYGYNIQYMFFTTCIGNLFKIIGISRLFVQFLLMLCSMVTLYIICIILTKLKIPPNEQNKIILIIGLLPNFAILSSIFLRESLITMFVTISVYFFICWMQEKKNRYFIYSFIMVLMAAAFHSGVIALLAGYMVIQYIYVKDEDKFNFNVKNLLPVMIFIIIFIYLYQNHSETFFTKMQNIDSIEDISSNLERGNSSYAKYVGASKGINGIMLYSLPRMFYFLFSPLPWQWRGIPDIIAFTFSSLFYMYIIFTVYNYLLLNRRNNRNHNILISLVIISISSLFVFAWGCNNTGTATRHRDKMMSIYSIMLAIINDESKKTYNK